MSDGHSGDGAVEGLKDLILRRTFWYGMSSIFFVMAALVLSFKNFGKPSPSLVELRVEALMWAFSVIIKTLEVTVATSICRSKGVKPPDAIWYNTAVIASLSISSALMAFMMISGNSHRGVWDIVSISLVTVLAVRGFEFSAIVNAKR